MPFFKAVRIGLLGGLGVFSAACIGVSLLQQFTDISDPVMSFFGIFILGLSSFFSAYFSTQLCRTKGLIQGLICGFAVFMILCVFSIIFSSPELSFDILKKALAIIICGSVGGIKGINTKKTGL